MGILINNESITINQEGDIGVYARRKNGDFEFVRIKVINTDGYTSVVEDSVFYDDNGKEVKTVDIYDEILRKGGK